VDPRLAAAFDYLGEARCFSLEQFHLRMAGPAGWSDSV
jgi:hypothetical protein